MQQIDSQTPAGENAPPAAAGAAPGEWLIRPAWPIDLALSVASHGWAELAPWRWDAQRARLARTERVGGAIGVLSLTQLGPRALAVAWSGAAHGGRAAEFHRRAERWVSAAWDPMPAILALRPALPAEAALVERGGRILRCSSFYEDFVKTVLTINTSWAATRRMAATLVAEPGGGAFPTPAMLLDYGEARLRERAKLGFRAATLVSATGRLLDDGAIDADGEGDASGLDHDYLTSLKGIGPYAAAHCRLLLGDFARLPVDSAVIAYLRERHGTGPAEFLASRADTADYLALGYRLTRLCEKLADTGGSLQAS